MDWIGLHLFCPPPQYQLSVSVPILFSLGYSEDLSERHGPVDVQVCLTASVMGHQ